MRGTKTAPSQSRLLRMGRGWLVRLVATWPLFAQVRITYLANEGVLLTSPEAKVLVDALFRDSLGDYVRHSTSTQEQLEAGRSPFDRITLALATHYHLDHWDAGAISRFLHVNAQATFASTPQATGMLPREISSQVRALRDGSGQSSTLEVSGVRVEAVPLLHGETQNLGFRVLVGDRVLTHLGDAEPNGTNFDRLLASGTADVALVPFWWLLDEEGRAFLQHRWKPRHIVAFHFGAADVAKSAEKVRAALPAAWLCTRPGESRAY